MNKKLIHTLLIISIVEGFVCLYWSLSSPSEASSARLWGYSYFRLALAGMIMTGIGGLFYTLLMSRLSKSRIIFDQCVHWFSSGNRFYWLQTGFFTLTFLAGWLFFFSWLFIPANLRPLLAWIILLSLQSGLAAPVFFKKERSSPSFSERFKWTPPTSKNLTPSQKRTLLVLGIVSLIYFSIFIPINLRGAENEHAFFVTGGDEYVIYPILNAILTPGNDFSSTLYHIFIYEDYHYGYPFYVVSALVVLPFRFIFGNGFAAQTQINLLVLRQFVSVLPIILSALFLTYLATRFKSILPALGLYIFLLTIPGVIKYNQWFWHPDSLNLLFIVLTLFFLERDQFKFGPDFFISAVFCGLSVATRLYGLFFFLAIAGYLFTGWKRKLITFQKMIQIGFFFIVLMTIIVILADPFLLDTNARSRMVSILKEKSGEMAQGYQEADPEGVYKTGWNAWIPHFSYTYAGIVFLIFLFISALAATLCGKNRLFHALLISFCSVLMLYLVYFVRAKSFQYMLPLMMPLHAAALSLPALAETSRGLDASTDIQLKRRKIFLWFISGAAMLGQALINWQKFPGP